MVVATHNVRLFILSTNLRIFTALCLYFGFCHAYRITTTQHNMHNNNYSKRSSRDVYLVEELGWLDLGKEGEVDDGHLPCNFLRVEVEDGQQGRWVGGNLHEEDQAMNERMTTARTKKLLTVLPLLEVEGHETS